MSGGHFDYKDYCLEIVIDKLTKDIKHNDVEYDNAYMAYKGNDAGDLFFGFQHKKGTLDKVRYMIAQCEVLKNNLHEYDLYVSGDTNEQTFLDSYMEMNNI
jgi:hypothetical protein